MSSTSKFPVEGRNCIDVQEMAYKFPSVNGEAYNTIMGRIQKEHILHEDVVRAWDEFGGLNLSWMEGLTPAEQLASQYVTKPWLVSKAFQLLDLRQNGLGNVSADEKGNWYITGKIRRKVSLQPAALQEDLGMRLFRDFMHYTKFVPENYHKALVILKIIGSYKDEMSDGLWLDVKEMRVNMLHGMRTMDKHTWVEFWDEYISPILDRCHGKAAFGWAREIVKLEHTDFEKAEELDGYPSGPAAHYSSIYKWIPKMGANGETEFTCSFTGQVSEDIALEEADFGSENNIKRGEDYQAWMSKVILADAAMRKATRLDYTSFSQTMVELRAKARWLKLKLQQELDMISDKESEIYQLRNLYQETCKGGNQDLIKQISEKGKALVEEFKKLENRSMFEGPNFDFFMQRSQFYPNWFKPENLPVEKEKHTGWPGEKRMKALCAYSRNEKCHRDKTQLMVEAMKTFPDKSFEFLLVQYENLGGKPGKVDMLRIYKYELSIAKTKEEVDRLRALIDCKA